MSKKLLQHAIRGLVKEAIGNRDFDHFRAKVDQELKKLMGVGLDDLGIPEPALMMRFRRGDDAETVALVIKQSNEE